MIAEATTTIVLSVSIYCLMKMFFQYKVVSVLVAGADEKLRRAVTDRMLAQGKKLEGWPEIMTDSIRHKVDIGRDEYTFFEIRGYPANHYHILDHFKVAIFIIDCAAEDQSESLELFKSAMKLAPLKGTKFLIYTLRPDAETVKNISDEEIKEIYGLQQFQQEWRIQPVSYQWHSLHLSGVENGVNWIKSIV